MKYKPIIYGIILLLCLTCCSPNASDLESSFESSLIFQVSSSGAYTIEIPGNVYSFLGMEDENIANNLREMMETGEWLRYVPYRLKKTSFYLTTEESDEETLFSDEYTIEFEGSIWDILDNIAQSKNWNMNLDKIRENFITLTDHTDNTVRIIFPVEPEEMDKVLFRECLSIPDFEPVDGKCPEFPFNPYFAQETKIVEHSVMERIFDEILLSYNSPVIVITGLHGWTGSLTIYEPWQNKDFILGLLFLFQQEGLSPYDSYAFLIQTYGMQGAELAEDELIDKDLGVGPEHQTDSVYLINRMFGNVLPVDESNHYIDKKPEKNILFGHSMGGAGTCYYGSEYCDDYKKYGGLIIIPFHPALISVCKEGVDDCNPNIWSENWKNQFWINLGNSLREFKPVGGISDDKTKEILEDYLWKLTNKIVFNSHIRALTGEKRRESLRSAVLTRKGNENQRGFTKEDWENLKDCRATLIYTSDGDRMISSKMLENMIPDDVHFIVLEGLTHYTFMVDGIFDVYSDIYTSLSSSALASVQRPKAGVRTSSYIMNLPAEEEA